MRGSTHGMRGRLQLRRWVVITISISIEGGSVTLTVETGSVKLSPVAARILARQLTRSAREAETRATAWADAGGKPADG